MHRAGIILLAGILAVGCASKAPVDPRVAEVTAGVTAERTSFDVYEKFQGPEFALAAADGYVLIRSWKEPNRPRAEHQLYVHVMHDGRPKEFLSASLPGGDLVDIKRIDTGELCQQPDAAAECGLFEDVGIWVDTTDLKQAARDRGIILRLNAKRGDDVIVEVPAWYLKGYLAAIN